MDEKILQLLKKSVQDCIHGYKDCHCEECILHAIIVDGKTEDMCDYILSLKD